MIILIDFKIELSVLGIGHIGQTIIMLPQYTQMAFSGKCSIVAQIGVTPLVIPILLPFVISRSLP